MVIPEPVRIFLEQPHYCVMATINRDNSPQLTVMWYDLVDDLIIMNMTRGLVKERNLRRDSRLSICIEDGMRYVTLSGRAEIVEDRALQEVEVNRMSIRYLGLRLGSQRWSVIAHQDRLGIHMRVEKVQARNL